ncbi:hypothetical protein CEXT_132621 [Caerostris extrusa]|uniref:Uncharacterized protein n=1 Tax=Caerostris extrusa TaxID=172846 RepID=A0AAV4W404_CAEEX|nr:hypothetical protein CEXT_132621 [Caerostris extrusa]
MKSESLQVSMAPPRLEPGLLWNGRDLSVQEFIVSTRMKTQEFPIRLLSRVSHPVTTPGPSRQYIYYHPHLCNWNAAGILMKYGTYGQKIHWTIVVINGVH